MRVLIWDIESTGLVADFATILCIGYKWLGEKQVSVLSITDYPEFKKDPTDPEAEKRLIQDFLKVYVQADATTAYNGVSFDRPMIYTKCLEHGLEIPPNITMIDPYWTVKPHLRMSRKSLNNITNFLGLKKKTPVEGKVWKRAMGGHAASIKYIIEHCRKDVLVLEAVYIRLRPLMRTHVRLSEHLGRCRYCNGRVQSRGRQVSKNKAPVRRVQCIQCGGWDTRTLKEVDKFKL